MTSYLVKHKLPGNALGVARLESKLRYICNPCTNQGMHAAADRVVNARSPHACMLVAPSWWKNPTQEPHARPCVRFSKTFRSCRDAGHNPNCSVCGMRGALRFAQPSAISLRGNTGACPRICWKSLLPGKNYLVNKSYLVNYMVNYLVK